MRLINHQTQPCPVSCVSTCLAMLLDRPAEAVIEQFHKRYREHGISMREMLSQLAIPFNSFDTCDDRLLDSVGAYLVVVPSLNITGGTHQILIEVTEDDYYVIDPVMGRQGRRYYVNRGAASGDLEIELNSFTIEAFIDASWLRSR